MSCLLWGDNPNDIEPAFKSLLLNWENYVTVSARKAREMLADAFNFIERKDLACRVIGNIQYLTLTKLKGGGGTGGHGSPVDQCKKEKEKKGG